MTRDSLFANTTSLPDLRAARVGIKPAAPTTATTTISASLKEASSCNESIPVSRFVQLGKVITEAFSLLKQAWGTLNSPAIFNSFSA